MQVILTASLATRFDILDEPGEESFTMSKSEKQARINSSSSYEGRRYGIVRYRISHDDSDAALL